MTRPDFPDIHAALARRLRPVAPLQRIGYVDPAPLGAHDRERGTAMDTTEQGAVNARPMDDTTAMDAVAALLDGREWSPDTTVDVAQLVRATGRTIGEPQ